MNNLFSRHDATLEFAASPLLRLARKITGLESSFITAIDWKGEKQKIVFALNEGTLELAEGINFDWPDSMCHSMFLSGSSSGTGVDTPPSPGAVTLGIRTCHAVPILVGGSAVGTVGAASRRQLLLSAPQLEGLQLIADALQQLLEVDCERSLALARAALAERESLDARNDAKRHATDSLHMEQLAYTDSLTGLPNRRAFIARWEHEISSSADGQRPLGLVLIDANEIGLVNDTFGHLKGEAVLRAIGTALLAVARTPDVVARLGGDEFALMTTHIDGLQMVALADDIQRSFAAVAAELGVGTTLSIGMVSSDDCPRDKMFVEADRALFRSKAGDGNVAEMFDRLDNPPTLPAKGAPPLENRRIV